MCPSCLLALPSSSRHYIYNHFFDCMFFINILLIFFQSFAILVFLPCFSSLRSCQNIMTVSSGLSLTPIRLNLSSMFFPQVVLILGLVIKHLILEREFADWSSSSHAIALANGSLALSAAYLALGIGKDDEIITTPRTFIATSSSAVLLGAKPVFADVDINSGCITPETIAPLINSRTKAISVVHLGGWPAQMPEIIDLARSYSLRVVEDCAQAHGTH